MRIAVFGTGAVGGYFGGRLAQAGEDVVFIARGAQLQALQERGLRVESPKGDFLLHPAQATADPAQVGLPPDSAAPVPAAAIPVAFLCTAAKGLLLSTQWSDAFS